MPTLVLANARILDLRRAEPWREGHLVIEDGRIADLVEGEPAPAGRDSLDLGGRCLLPGLIDAHFHALAADPDIGALEAMPRSLLYQHARHLLEAALERGFTTVRDAGGADYGLAKAIECGLIRGPRLFYSGRALSQTGGHGDFRPLEGGPLCECCVGALSLCEVADGVDAVRRAAREQLRRGATQIKIMASGGVASPSDPIWNLQYSEEEIRAAVWEAASWKTYVMAHAYTPEAIHRSLTFGVRSIEHGNLIDLETARLAAAKGAFVVPTLATYDALAAEGSALGLPPVSVAKVAEVQQAGRRSLEILKEAKVAIGFGTDLLGAMHRRQTSEFSIRAEVLGAREVLEQATLVNARLLRREGELGELVPGALADLVALQGDPLEDISLLDRGGQSLDLIVKGGEVFRSRL